MADETYPGDNEPNPLDQVPLYERPEVIERAQSDERLTQQLDGLRKADQGRAISPELRTQMEEAVKEHLRSNYPDLLPPPPEGHQ